MSFKETMRTKLKNQNGETIGETLVALLIASLALVMLASMIQTTVNVVKKSETIMTTYYDAESKMETAPSASATISITDTEGTLSVSESIKYSANTTFAKPVVAYSYDGTGQNGSSSEGTGG